MNIIKTSYFKSDLKKGQIQALAIDHSKELYESENCIDSHVMLKKAKLYIDTLLMENEKNALLIWEANASEYRNITYNQGGPRAPGTSSRWRRRPTWLCPWTEGRNRRSPRRPRTSTPPP